jgi:transposase
MARKEYMVVDIVDILRRCQSGDAIRSLARATGMGRNTVKKYLRLAYKRGFTPEAPCDLERIAAEVLTELNACLPGPAPSKGQVLLPHKETIKEWMEDEHLTLTKIHSKLTRLGITATYSGLYRFVASEIGLPSRTTVRMAETEPGEVAEVDFGRLGLVYDPESDKKRFVYGLVVTLVFSRHQYVAVSLTQELPVLISGMEDAWQFFGGVTRRVVIDNLKDAVIKADRYVPVFNRTFLEYSDYRGFIIDPAPRAMATGKPTVERQIPYVRKNFFQGETFRDLAHIQEEAILWCTETAGMRIHGTTRKRPVIVFTEEEKEKLLPLVKGRFDTPTWASPTLHPDHHVRIGYSLYSAPTAYIGKKLDARKDSRLVRLYYKGQLIKTHPVILPGKRSTDFNDYLKEKTAYAMRSCAYHIEKAEEIGESCKTFMERLLAGDFPWARLRQAQKLLRLPETYGRDRVEMACRRALSFDLIDVRRVEGMIIKGFEGIEGASRGTVIAPARFARPASYFAGDGQHHQEE